MPISAGFPRSVSDRTASFHVRSRPTAATRRPGAWFAAVFVRQFPEGCAVDKEYVRAVVAFLTNDWPRFELLIGCDQRGER
jgi:hypothetical protein